MAKIKCSICSYQFNIWYAGHSPAHILIWFLAFGQGSEVYLTLTTGCLGLALQPSAAHCLIMKRSVPMKFHMYPSWRMARQRDRAFSGSVLWKTPENLGILIFIFQIKILFSGKWSFLHISYTDTIRFSQKNEYFLYYSLRMYEMHNMGYTDIKKCLFAYLTQISRFSKYRLFA